MGTHGLASNYRARRPCRCDKCRAAHTARQALEEAQRAARLAADPTLASHGTEATYKNWRCRCGPCTQANSAGCLRRRNARKARAGSPTTEEVTNP